jgi:hypothetical protein
MMEKIFERKHISVICERKKKTVSRYKSSQIRKCGAERSVPRSNTKGPYFLQ